VTVIVTNRGAAPYPAAMRYLAAVFVLAACASDPAPAADAGADAVAVDTGAEDAGATDAGQLDTGAPDAGAAEDVSPAADADAPAADTGPADAGAVDAGPEDAGQPNAGPVDAGTPDAPEAGIACPMGLGDCDGDPSNGCEVDLRNNLEHCGGCGMACFRAPNIVRACRSTGCDPFRCASGRANCDGDMANGCEINITTDARHCGGCGRVCPRDGGLFGACSSGSCR